jgi:transglutaminase-like putative cysteine protease
VHKHIDRAAAKRITYRLSVTGNGEDLPALPTTGMQVPGQADARSGELVVRRQDHAALKHTAKIVPADELDASVRPFLTPSLYINCDDPAVIAMAKEAADGEQDAYALVDKLRRYVTREITQKGLDVGFASASEVCRDRKGDCSEHAVLLAALARARGIPARVVTGLVYVPTFSGHDDVFGFHMWTQVYVAGQWVDIDAAQRETDCNPTHIALAVLSNKESSMSEAAFALLPVIGRLKIEVIKVE